MQEPVTALKADLVVALKWLSIINSPVSEQTWDIKWCVKMDRSEAYDVFFDV
jgi:hypothetical protein